MLREDGQKSVARSMGIMRAEQTALQMPVSYALFVCESLLLCT